MDPPGGARDETYNPWSIVNLVFAHLAQQGLHPVLGDRGDPGGPAADLLRSLGIEPAAEGNRQVSHDVRRHLADIRAAVFGESGPAGGARRQDKTIKAAGRWSQPTRLTGEE
ncbi:hypothetical protein [Planosporangium flavigriseum]|uniref:Uncharacterized protein n=1 Tax=Planosporangium flavigriseum TaxID=373681 RepID=A0A8J3LRA1_9ACTN|nr:hypothetical protein [Planosporangium flavigriseum]GIG76582.1 hypothetical protein Pfl04_49860 [Planosporangium flavigriseum]